MNWQRILFKCSKCDGPSWMEINLEKTYISVDDLLCDECNPGEN